MTSINSQLHVLPEETIRFVEVWVKGRDLYIFAMKFFPFILSDLSNENNLYESLRTFKGLRRICLGFQKPNLSVDTPYDFLCKNPNYFTIDIGELIEEGLRESVLSCTTNDLNDLKLWQKFARSFKKETVTGLWAVDSDTKNKAFYKGARFTKGAYDLAKSGKKLLPIAGSAHYELNEPTFT